MIRYDQAYNQQIARVVSNYNRKIARLSKNGHNLLPSKVSIRDVKSQFSDRRELNKYLRDLKRFGRRGAEDIVTVNGKQFTAYDVDLFRRSLRAERSRLSKDIKRAESMNPKYPMQHNIFVQNLRAKRQRLASNWATIIVDKARDVLIEQPYKRAVIYDNYLQLLFQDAYQIDYDDEKLEYIKTKLLELKPRQFIRALEDDPNIQYIFDYYHSLTRTSQEDPNARDVFDQLYENIDEIVAKYK